MRLKDGMSKDDLARRLGLIDSTMLVIGNIIGAGIFITTGLIAGDIPSAGLIILAWVLGGLISLAGAISCAELGTAMPMAGGDYIYLREAYGPLWGFLTGWASFLVTFSGSIAALAVAFTDYISFFFPFFSLHHIILSLNLFSLSTGHLFAISLVISLSAINYLGIKWGSWVQNFLTSLKLGAIIALVFLGFILGKGSVHNFHPFFSIEGSNSIISSLALVLIPILFTYSGWNAIVYVAGEVKDPRRNIPLSLILGTLVSLWVYVALNCVYIYALPIGDMKDVLRIGELASTSLFGLRGSGYISAAIAISILGSMNVAILAGPRIYYAMAKDNLFFKGAAQVHPEFKTPATSLKIQALWSSLLIISGSFEQLLTYVTFVIVLFSSLTVGAVFVLRIKKPHMVRPYKAWGYPFVPGLFILASLWIMINTLMRSPYEAVLGLLIVGLGIPAYAGFLKYSRTSLSAMSGKLW